MNTLRSINECRRKIEHCAAVARHYENHSDEQLKASPFSKGEVNLIKKFGTHKNSHKNSENPISQENVEIIIDEAPIMVDKTQ